ncbi:MAG: ABC transporter ATP-binding protein/permease [Acholeplasmatales bacterium]|jgi:ATP-binding cassette subfamily B protein|nr:ABC transporter ATP-binding protein/permease [Acholeplasmatales bacterium]
MIKIFKYIKLWYIPIFVLIGGLLVFQVWCDTNMPELLGKIIGDVMSQVNKGTNMSSSIWSNGLLMLAYSAGSVVATIAVSFLSSRLGTGLSADLREKIFSKVASFNKNEINQFQTASLVTRTTNDIAQIQMAIIFGIRLIITSPLTIIIAFTKVQNTHIDFTIALITAVVTLLVMIVVLFILAFPKFNKIQEKIDKLNLYSRENLMGVRVIRAYNAENYQDKKYEKANEDYYKMSLFANRTMSFFNPGMQIILNFLNLSLVLVLAYLINSGSLGFTPSSLFDGISSQTAFQGFAMQIFFSFMQLTMLFFLLPRAQVSAKRVLAVLNTRNSITDPIIGEEIILENEPLLEFQDVSFKYEGAQENVLSNINLVCKKGETVAFTGSTGSGKSTLINLVPRFFDATEGNILFHGVNIKDINQADLRDKMGYVPQTGFLFNSTIRDNMKISKEDATDEEINEALKIACAYDFVYEFDKNLDYEIAQSGKNVSGGQRQRLSIARAILKNPDIYIFDDSFSALDYKTDRVVRNNLQSKTKDSLTLIVSQRIGTILHADKIVVLENGHIIGLGSHSELMNSCTSYKEMAFSQLSKEELGL